MPAPPPTARLTFREMTLDDLDDMAGMLGDPEVMWVYPHPLSRDEAAQWIQRNIDGYRERGYGLWLLQLRETGAFVGECGFVPQVVEGETLMELGYHVTPALQGRGLATEAGAACRAFARDVLGLDRMVALIDPRNIASQRVAAKIGLAWERDAQVPDKVLGVWSADLWPPSAANRGLTGD